MKELVVISGKGGTGKTSLVASFAALAKSLVLVDCDVDAADLHLLLEPRVSFREDVLGSSKARIKPGHCTACGKCEELCRFDAIYYDGPSNGHIGKTFRVDRLACEGCGVCVDYCAEAAIEFAPAVAGQWFISSTRCGPMIHAKLGVATENSGKLVTQIRKAAQQVAAKHQLDLILCDGSPGIGCPVIASLTGASFSLCVVEPTPSGLHDFYRVAQLTQRLGVPGGIVVNKADLNLDMAEKIERAACAHGVSLLGRVPYDPDVTRAQIAGRSVVEASLGPAAQAIRQIWLEVRNRLQTSELPTDGGLIQLSTPYTNTLMESKSRR
jgi:MinD superfamily P-loop ATPase